MVTVEIDIAADGTITATPNPVSVASGGTLYIHVRSNASDRTKFTMDFPGGPQSPFNAGKVTVLARHCNGGGSPVNWPPDVNRASVRVSAHSSPASAGLDIVIERAMDAGGLDARHERGAARPFIVQNYYFSSERDREEASQESSLGRGIDVSLSTVVKEPCGSSAKETKFPVVMGQVSVTITVSGDCDVTVTLKNGGTEVTTSTVPHGSKQITVSGNKVDTIQIACGSAPAGGTSNCEYDFAISAS